nr:MAG TPA: Protein of unknown function (DUF668) [Caudoviricetes sp.]
MLYITEQLPLTSIELSVFCVEVLLLHYTNILINIET